MNLEAVPVLSTCNFPKLSQLGFERYNGNQRFLVDGTRGAIWVHSKRWLNGVAADDFLKQKLKDAEGDFEV